MKCRILMCVMMIYVLTMINASAMKPDFENPFGNDFIMVVNTNVEGDAEYTGLAEKVETNEAESELFSDSNVETDFYDIALDEVELMSESEPVSYSLGDIKTIYSVNLGKEIEIKVVGMGEKYTLWSDSSLEYQGEYDFIGQEFDSKICEMLTGMFGEWYDVDGDGKVALLVYELPEWNAGYVANYDLYKNNIDCVNLNSKCLDTVNETLAHEFTHLLSFSQKKHFLNTWIEEGIATVAEDIYNGEIDIDAYNLCGWDINNGLSFLNWSSVKNYNQANMFMHYLNEQVKQAGGKEYEVLVKIAKHSEYKDYRAVESVMQEYYPGITMQDLLLNYSVALAVKERTGPYGFGGNKIFDKIIVNISDGKDVYVSIDDYTLLGGGYKILPCKNIDFSNINEKGDNIRYVGIEYELIVDNQIDAVNTCVYWSAYINTVEKNQEYRIIVTSYDAEGFLYDIHIHDCFLEGEEFWDTTYRYVVGVEGCLVYEGEDDSYVPAEDDEWWSVYDNILGCGIKPVVIKAVRGGTIKGFVLDVNNGIIPICEGASSEVRVQ